MEYFLISFHTYEYLGDGQHENGTKTKLVKASDYESAVHKIKMHYHDSGIQVSQFENQTL